MPLVFIILVLIVVGIAALFIFANRSQGPLPFDNRNFYLPIFILSLVSLLISVKLFWNMGVYADEYGSSPTLVSGGTFWLLMDWLRLALLFALCLLSALKLRKPQD
ncbi:MAG: hypothetical protein PWQ55_2133 [Chloroflexota bacterium]|nr:hypothetical protein [Chloroflexota bacterium]